MFGAFAVVYDRVCSKQRRLPVGLVAVEHLARRVRVPGMMRGLLDEMQQHPAQIDPGHWRPRKADAGRVETGRGSHRPLGHVRARRVRLDDVGERPIVADAELLLTSPRDGLTGVAAIDPSFFDTGKVVHDPDQRNQATVRPPARLLFGQADGRRHHELALELQVAQQEFPFVARRFDVGRTREPHR